MTPLPLELNIGAHWKSLRLEHDVRLQDLAYLNSCSPKTIQRIETNVKIPDMLQLARTALVYGVSLPLMYPPRMFDVLLRYVTWQQPFDLEDAIHRLTQNGTRTDDDLTR